MADSLQEQLIKAGLATEEQARKKRPGRGKGAKSGKRPGKPRRGAKAGPHSSAKSAAKSAAKGSAEDDISLAAAYAIRAKKDKREVERERKRKQFEDQQRQRINLQLKEIVLPAAQNDPNAEAERFFEYKGKIRKLFVTPDQLAALNDGRLALVYLQGRHYVVERSVAEQVSAIQADNVSLLQEKASEA